MDINLMTPINMLSYGYVGFNILKELIKIDNVCLYPIGAIEVENNEDVALLNKIINNSSMFNPKAPTLRIFHQFSMAESIGRGPRIGFPIFELLDLTPQECHHLNSLDKVIVCSQWAVDVLKHNNITPRSHIVPLGVDTSIFKPGLETPSPTTCRFIHIGKAEVRKGIDFIGECFNRAFTLQDDVELFMVTFNPFIEQKGGNKEWAQFYMRSKMGPKIRFIGRVPNQREIAKLINICDCGVFPSRGEGWNLPLLETMACGKPVITTRWSAHTEFCNDENSYLIDLDDTELAYDGVFFKNQGRWGKFGKNQKDLLVDMMRSVYNRKKEGWAPSNPKGVETAKELSWSNTCSKLRYAISNA